MWTELDHVVLADLGVAPLELADVLVGGDISISAHQLVQHGRDLRGGHVEEGLSGDGSNNLVPGTSGHFSNKKVEQLFAWKIFSSRLRCFRSGVAGKKSRMFCTNPNGIPRD